MKKERIITRRWGDRRKGKTDWKRFGAITDAEVEASIANDPDWAEFKDIDWSDAVFGDAGEEEGHLHPRR